MSRITAGLGGVFTEALGDAALRLPPFGTEEAERMLRSLRAARVLKGFRGKPPVDVRAAAQVISQVSLMASELEGEISELDINPLIASPSGVSAVDIRIRRA